MTAHHDAHGHGHALKPSALGLSAWQRAGRLLWPLAVLWLGVAWALATPG
jgi:hypothetical protein